MDTIDLDQLERRHQDAPKYVGTNQGIKLYAEEAREELLNLIGVVRELDSNFRALAQASERAHRKLKTAWDALRQAEQERMFWSIFGEIYQCRLCGAESDDNSHMAHSGTCPFAALVATFDEE